MVASFFYLLRQRGLDVSLNEWLTLLEGMEKGLHRSTLTGFYQLCRAVLLHSESEYDRFDQVFLEFFRDVPWEGELPRELMDWLDHPTEDLRRTLEELRRRRGEDKTLEEILQMLEERLREQTEEHNGGNYWIGTQGSSVFGNSGWRPNSLRVGGESRRRAALAVAGERRFRDFRKDATLDTRQFQMAFRLLRQFSAQISDAEKVLDVEGTIRDTCDQAGLLKIRYRNPRRNAVKVLLLIDSGGSMDYYSDLCSTLFQAATKSNTFQELHTYYFHNCINERLHLEPTLIDMGEDTESVLSNLDSEYRVIVVGDAMMAPEELYYPKYDWRARRYGKQAGIEYLEQLKNRYSHIIWLNPQPRAELHSYWAATYDELAKIFDMYDLTVDGLERGIERLLVRY